MNPCPESERIQSYLDAELSADEIRRLLEHATLCARCTRELALYRRVVRSLEALPTVDPGPAFTARVLDMVLPSRVRRRWLRTLGLSYASAFTVIGASAITLATQPAARALILALVSEVSRRVVQTMIFTVNALSFSVLSVAEGGRLLESTGQRLAPLVRAANALFSHTSVTVPLAVAVGVCAGLLWWMRPRERHPEKGVGHVGVLGF